MQVAILAHSARRHDAVGNQVLEKVLYFGENGAQVRVFLHSRANLHPHLLPITTEVQQALVSGPAWEFLRDCDLVLAEYSQYFPLLDTLPLLTGEKPRLVLDFHGVTPPELAAGPLRQTLELSRAQMGLAWCTETVLAHSNSAAEDLCQQTGFPPGKVIRLDLPIEDAFRPGEVRSIAGIPSLKDGQILLFVGRMALNKRPHLIIQALHRLRDRRPALHAIFIGDGTDQYARQVQECQVLASQLGIQDRVHFPGQLSLDGLVQAYRSANLLVLPSIHEGFGVPLREAMACGLPVLAARSTALPETIGDAGLTFRPDDADDLSARISRILDDIPSPREPGTPAPKGMRIALACFRFGADILGGAERSLLTMARALKDLGCSVEVFTTCNRAEDDWKNELPAGTTRADGLIVHRFPMDAHDRERHLLSLQRLRDHPGPIPHDLAEEYLRHSIHSRALIDSLNEHAEEFEAILTGPYLFGLTWDVARAFPRKTLLVPCFHDEPLAYLPSWPDVYGRVGGILFHSAGEQDFAQGRLGINHPNASVIGTLLPPSPMPHGKESRTDLPYVVYCGRYSPEKGLPRLLENAERFQREHPDRLRFVFLGQGKVKIPSTPWARDLGFVEETRKAEVMRGALALVQPSWNESLSLVALEAWREGTPVIAEERCAALRGMVERCEGGLLARDYPTFAGALHHLLDHPEAAARLGENGRDFVRNHFQNPSTFAQCLWQPILNLNVPLASLMKEKGLIRAEKSRRQAWRAAFSHWLDGLLHSPCSERQFQLDIHLDQATQEVGAGERNVLVPITLLNQGELPAANRGPGRTLVFTAATLSESNNQVGPVQQFDLPDLILPGQTRAAAVTIALPGKSGAYTGHVWIGREGDDLLPSEATTQIELRARDGVCDTPTPGYLRIAQEALAAALPLRRLPDDYVDVTEGWFSRLKRWLKAKILGNFRRSYVDVLSRQQSQVNQHLIQAVAQLSRCCATLDHALRAMERRVAELEESHSSPLPPSAGKNKYHETGVPKEKGG